MGPVVTESQSALNATTVRPVLIIMDLESPSPISGQLSSCFGTGPRANFSTSFNGFLDEAISMDGVGCS